ncbi:hypothetical protein [Prosthecobacter sp.]|uniref:hypothetical protein n=1 Tax=Prosthecobacter sp. TaxID=1965333 RepID=UPI00378389DC
MNDELLSDLALTMTEHGFVRVDGIASIPDALLLLKRQTWNTNRAIVVVSPDEPPADFRAYLRQLRKRVAFKCGFFPLVWGIGIQVVIIGPGLAQRGIDPARHVARFDNQWAIIQNLFLADPAAGTCQAARTWGQYITGKFQDAISEVLSGYFQLAPNERHT